MSVVPYTVLFTLTQLNSTSINGRRCKNLNVRI